MPGSMYDPGLLRGAVIASGTNPAAGVEISETVPAGQVWGLIAFTFTLVTSATVANRRVRLTLDDGTNVFWRTSSLTDQAASTTIVHSASTDVTPVATGGSTGLLALPKPAVLKPGYRIKTITALLDSGDDFGAPVYQYVLL